MDITIYTKDYELVVDNYVLSFIVIFMSRYLYEVPEEGTYYLSKNEMKKLIDYLYVNKLSFYNMKYFDFIIDRFENLISLMQGNEKAKFIFCNIFFIYKKRIIKKC